MWFLINQYSLVFALLFIGPVSWIVVSRALDWKWGTLSLVFFCIGALLFFFTQSSKSSLIDTRGNGIMLSLQVLRCWWNFTLIIELDA